MWFSITLCFGVCSLTYLCLPFILSHGFIIQEVESPLNTVGSVSGQESQLNPEPDRWLRGWMLGSPHRSAGSGLCAHKTSGKGLGADTAAGLKS